MVSDYQLSATRFIISFKSSLKSSRSSKVIAPSLNSDSIYKIDLICSSHTEHRSFSCPLLSFFPVSKTCPMHLPLHLITLYIPCLISPYRLPASPKSFFGIISNLSLRIYSLITIPHTTQISTIYHPNKKSSKSSSASRNSGFRSLSISFSKLIAS